MVIKRSLKSILVTGGYGFIGSNFIRFIFNLPQFSGKVINLDALTYAGNPLNLNDIEKEYGEDRYFFIHGSINDAEMVSRVLEKHNIDTIVHFAAESHVDRSIHGPADFIKTNIMGTFTLLEAVRSFWGSRKDVLFHHVSTDEVYGSLRETGLFSEDSPYDPHSPYSASKAGSDHLVSAYYYTYGLPVTISNCSNNYGPYQFPEKLIPLMILNMKDELPLPIYGDGKYIRDWLFVDDHNSGLWTIVQNGKIGEKYNIGGENEWENIRLINTLCELMADKLGKKRDYYKNLISFVKDRPGHDRRYAIDCEKLKKDLGWRQQYNFSQGLEVTVDWYINNPLWISNVKTGKYNKWIELNYKYT